MKLTTFLRLPVSSFQKSLFAILTVLCVTGVFAKTTPALPENPENFHIFLLMGQSNMEGGQSIDGAMDKEPHPRILKLNSWNSWEQAVDPITNNYKVAVGPGLSFAKKLVEEDENITVGLVPLSVGGTQISEWMKGSALYSRTMSAVAVARQHGVIKGILWHQGEHDAIFQYTALQYDQNLETLIDQIRVDLGDVNLPFLVAGLVKGISQNKNHSQYALVQERLKQVGTQFYNTAYVPTNDIPEKGDNLHFSSDGQRILGQRYAEIYLQMKGHWIQKWWDELNAHDSDDLDDQGSTDDGSDEDVEDGEAGNSDEDAEDGGDDGDSETDPEQPDEEAPLIKWTWSDQLGKFQADDFPYIKHAQLGWLKVDAYADGSLLLQSPVFGNFRTFTENPENAIYIYRENPDPEQYQVHGDTYYVNLLAQSGSDLTFYNHTLESWQNTIEGSPLFTDVQEIYDMTETQFIDAQIDLSYMSTSPATVSWSEETKLLLDAQIHRNWVIIYGNECYDFADNNLEGDPREFWMDHALYLINNIDSVIIEAQQRWINYTDTLYTPAE